MSITFSNENDSGKIENSHKKNLAKEFHTGIKHESEKQDVV